MDDAPRKRLEPLALVVHGIAIAAIAGIAAFLLYELRSEPASPAPAAAENKRLGDAISDIRKWIDEKRVELQPPPPAVPAPAPKAQPGRPPAKTLAPREPNHTWRYAVTVEPQTWRDAVLLYRVPSEGGRLVAYTNFTHAGGSMQFRLGAMEPGDPAHANVRFPGFFLHTAYLPDPLLPGQRVTWSWPWQLPGGGVRAGRIKRFEGEVKEVERITVAAGTFDAVRVDIVLRYLEKGTVGGVSRETIWVAPQGRGIVKIVRDGIAPDEGFRHIVAELTEYK